MGIRVFFTKFYQPSNKNLFSSQYIFSTYRYFCAPASSKSDKGKSEEAPIPEDVLDDLREPELSEEEILRKRFKSRLPEVIYKKFVTKEPVPSFNQYDFLTTRLQKQYGRFGEASKLNPGICWPQREEVLETIHYDKIFEPPLQERIQNVEARRLAEEQRKKEYEDEVDKNMGNLDKWIADHRAKLRKVDEKAKELKAQRERLVEEISEYLGYDIDPKDPRFKEAVEQRDKERKKALKAKKQQESYDKMLEKLKKIAQNK